MTPSVSQRHLQTVVLAPQLRQGLRILTMGLPELRREIQKELRDNPVVEDVGGEAGEFEPEPSGGEATDSMEAEGGDASEFGDDEADALGVSCLDGANRGASDLAAAERRDRFFSSQVSEEGLEEHLLRQFPTSGIAEADFPLVEMLIGSLDEDGYFRGNLKEIAEVSGEGEAKLRDLLRRISAFDPPGCGATSLRECLLPQLDAIGDALMRRRVGALLNRLDDLAFVRHADRDVLAALRSLDPRPGRRYRKSRVGVDYVHPEIRAVPCKNGYRAVVDDKWMPTIHVSRRYLDLLKDPKTDDETKAYVRERLAAVRTLVDAVNNRQETIAAIAQVIFDEQPDFFRGGLRALRPLTMQQVADKAGVHRTTVSRTVRGKFVSTVRGTFELRQFFTSGIATDGGGSASVEAVLQRLKDLVRTEDMAHPLSDERLVRELKASGFSVARRTVTKYRKRLGIPAAAARAVRPS